MENIRAGIVGLGRLGKVYAHNLAFRIRHIDLVAACSLDKAERQFASEVLGIPGVYKDYSKMLSEEKLDVVFVISSTDRHAEHIIEGLQAGLHVFSEKPLAITINDCLKVEDISRQYPGQMVVVGFVRRFDPSYRYAWEKVQSGAVGTPFLVKSQTVDKDTIAAWQIQYATTSGGIFHDYNVHDIDLSRWFLGSEIKTVFSTGGSFKYPAFAEAGDADNVMTSCVFENGAMATIYASRTAMHGHDTYTEVVGTEGSLRIGRPAAKNRVEIYDIRGARRECVETFHERFGESFYLMAEDFIDCIRNGRKPELTLHDATQATRAAAAFTTSFREKRLVEI